MRRTIAAITTALVFGGLSQSVGGCGSSSKSGKHGADAGEEIDAGRTGTSGGSNNGGDQDAGSSNSSNNNSMNDQDAGSMGDDGGGSGLQCEADEIICVNNCVDPQTNTIFCGATACPGDPGETCSLGEACESGECVCDDCDDENPCTMDSCGNDNRCSHTCIMPLPEHVVELDCAACQIVECELDYADADDDATNGCEADRVDIWVNQANINDPVESGTQSHPYDTLDEGIAALKGGFTLHIMPGTYTGSFEIQTPDVTIEGTDQLASILSSSAGQAVLTVKASGVTVQDLTVYTAGTGVSFEGLLNGSISGGTAQRLSIRNLSGTTGTDSIGVKGRYIDDLLVQQITVDTVASGAGVYPGGAAGTAAGVLLSDTTGAEVNQVVVRNLSGGTGATGSGGPGGAGGAVLGVSIVDSENCSITSVEATDITGGTGGTVSSYTGGEGGLAAAVHLSGTMDCEVTAISALNITGGVGGRPSGSYVVGGRGGHAAAVVLDATTNSVVTAVIGRGITGGIGAESWGSYAVGGPGGMGTTILMDTTVGSSVTDMRGFTLAGGRGGVGSGSLATGGLGGRGIGIYMRDATPVLLSHMLFADMTGGNGGTGSGASAVGGDGSDGVGALLDGATSAVLQNITFDDMQAGALGTGSSGSGVAGTAFGARATAGLTSGKVSSVILRNVGGTCFSSDALNTIDLLSANDSLVFGCATAIDDNVTLTNVITGDPKFTDPINGDYRLVATSPAIDLGDPTAECSAEPAPNGCRINAGRFGGTSLAASMTGAEQCDVCP